MSVRVCSVFYEELPATLARTPHDAATFHGRLLLTLGIGWSVAAHPLVEAFGICGGDAAAVPGATAVEPSAVGEWLRARPSVWFEPARHYWWKAAALRQEAGVGVPIVTMLHGLGYARQILPLLGSLASPSLPGDVVIAPSEASAAALREQCRTLIGLFALKREPPRIAVIPYGVPPVVATPKPVAREALGWDADPVLLFIGRMSEADKADFAALFEAVARLRAKGRAARLVLAGSCTEPWLEAIRRHAWACGIGDVEVRLNVSDVEKHMLLSACDVFVSPSNTVSESFGLTLVEAMLHGLPIVCTDWSGYREIVRDGVDGFLVPTRWRADESSRAVDLRFVLGLQDSLADRVALDVAHFADALDRLVIDADLRARLGAAGQQRASAELRLDRTVHAIVTLLEEARAACPPTSVAAPRSAGLAHAFSGYASSLWTGDEMMAADGDASPERLRRQGMLSSGADAELFARLQRGDVPGVSRDMAFRWLRSGAAAWPAPAAAHTKTKGSGGE